MASRLPRFFASPLWWGTRIAVLAMLCVVPDAGADDTTPAVPLQPSVREMSPTDRDAVRLGRAVTLLRSGQSDAAAALLNGIDISVASPFPDADRAAFLLASIYLHNDDLDAFADVATRAADSTGSAYRRWLHTCAVVWLREVPAPESIQLYRAAVAAEAGGETGEAAWSRLADMDPQNELERDLIAAALIRLAAIRVDDTEAAADLLRKVPAGSRHAARAAHMFALIAVEVGDVETARSTLERILETHADYEGRRDVFVELGAMAMGRGEWETARAYFERAEADWLTERDALSVLESDTTVQAQTWQMWEQKGRWRSEVRLIPDALLDEMTELTRKALDLRSDEAPPSPSNVGSRLWPEPFVETGSVLAAHSPAEGEWRALEEWQRHLASSRNILARAEAAVEANQKRVESRLAYLIRGNRRASNSANRLTDVALEAQTMMSRVDSVVARLGNVRENALKQIGKRTNAMTGDLEQQVVFIRGVRRFHVDGPRTERPERFPEGVPDPALLLAREESLAVETQATIDRIAVHYPEVIAKSFDTIWKPRLARDPRAVYNAVVRELVRAERAHTAIDSTAKWYADPELNTAIALRDELRATVDSLRHEVDATRARITASVALRGRARMDRERESLDYHLADAYYELAVRDARPDSAASATPYRDTAMAQLSAFLERYPQSIARGESRFRLADLSLAKAREDFQAKMASFLTDNPSADDIDNRSLAPFVDYAPAIALYRSILAEDPDFPHMDAVLFNLGMILSDDGQDHADVHLQRLVREFPDSPHVQEAWLRMGSDRFDRKAFDECVPYFQSAAAGDDKSMVAIALYKMGWAHFERDRFDEATDTFRRLVDLYAGDSAVAAQVDLREEADAYLTHALSRAGGAEKFRTYFDALGGRPYESDILKSLGQLMRTKTMYPEAIACDRLWLERYPLDPDALLISQRLVATYQSWNKPDEARAAKLAEAERFLPRSTWSQHNTDTALQVDAQKFARSAIREAAAWHHARAREEDGTETEWRAALAGYEKYLGYWPHVRDAERLHYLAGESAAQLERHANAVAHFAAAAKTDSLDLARDALWARVASTDSWYRKTTLPGASTGADSLASALIAAADDYRHRFPDDARGADLAWRQGNLAYAHGWYDISANYFSGMCAQYPGDGRATAAQRLTGDAYYRLERFDDAGRAYERTLTGARAAGNDSLAVAMERTVPLCWFRHAEGVAGGAQSNNADAAPLFERVAADWPDYEHADMALYRAGLGYADGRRFDSAVRAWDTMLARYPDSEYARDGAVQIAETRERSGDKRAAAIAWERFSVQFSTDPDAPVALLHAAELLSDVQDTASAEAIKDTFLERFPDAVESVMAIREQRARAEVARVVDGSAMLGSVLSADASAPKSNLDHYLVLAEAHPELASQQLLAQVDHLRAEETFAAFSAVTITLPVEDSIKAKKERLETLVKSYEKSAAHGVPEYARASAHRIGQALIAFGDALIASERPADLSGDDLLAYDDVLTQQAWAFFDRGENVWTELLQQTRETKDDPGGWIARTQEALWPRLAERFLFKPEVDYPLVPGTPPAAPAGTETASRQSAPQ